MQPTEKHKKEIPAQGWAKGLYLQIDMDLWLYHYNQDTMTVLILASNLAQRSFMLFQLRITLQPKKQFPMEVTCDSFYDEILI